MRELDDETKALLEKENQRYKIAQEAMEIEMQVYRDKNAQDEAAHQLKVRDSDIKYQQNQNQALKNELERATSYYDTVLAEVRSKVDSEKDGIEELQRELQMLEAERDSLRTEISTIRREIDSKKEYRSGPSNSDLDIAIRTKLVQVEEAEEKRRSA